MRSPPPTWAQLLVLLVRVSTHGQKRNLPKQIEKLVQKISRSTSERWSIQHALESTGLFEDGTRRILLVIEIGSGSKSYDRRPKLRKAVHAAKGGVLMVQNRSRLARNAKVAKKVEEILGNDRIISLEAGEATPRGARVADLNAERSYFERNLEGARNRPDARNNDVASGHYVFHPRTIPDATRQLVERLYRDHSQREVAELMNADGLRTVTGCLWTKNSISRMLSKPSAEACRRRVSEIDKDLAVIYGAPKRGPMPFGIKRNDHCAYAFDPEFAPALKFTLEAHDNGTNNLDIEKQLNRLHERGLGPASPQKRRWNSTTVRNVLKKLRRSDGQPSDLAKHLAYVTPEPPYATGLRRALYPACGRSQ